MKPGRVKRVRVDWFTLLFEFPRSDHWSVLRGLNQPCDEAHSWPTRSAPQPHRELFVISISFRTYSAHSISTQLTTPKNVPLGPHLRDYLRPDHQVRLGSQRHRVPSRSIAQQHTSNFRPAATTAIFFRDFLPPLIR